MTPEKAAQGLKDEQLKLVACKLKLEGYTKLFEAQCYQGLGSDADKTRNIIVELTNESLDHLASISMFAAVIMRS